MTAKNPISRLVPGGVPCLQRTPSAISGRALLLAGVVAAALAGCGGGSGSGASAPSSGGSSGGGSTGGSGSSGSSGGTGTGTGTGGSGSGGAVEGPVIYIADQTTQGVDELYLVQSSAPGVSVKLNAPLVSGGNVYDFALSPDGQHVIYNADQDFDGRYEIYRVSLANPGVATKVNSPMVVNRDVLDFAASPDGSKVVYRADAEVDDVYELYMVDLSAPGTATKFSGALTPGGWVRGGYSFSPDSSRIVYRADQQVVERVELHSVAVASPGASIKLNTQLVMEGDVTSGFTFSPDSARVGYIADQDTDGVLELYSAALANPGVASKLNGPLTGGGDVCQFMFSPDSQSVAYCADQDTDDVIELYTVALDSPGASTKLNPALAAGGNVKAHYQFSADSSFVLYLADQQVDEQVELYRVDIAAPGIAARINSAMVADGDVWDFKLRPDGTHVGYVATQENVAIYELYEVALAAPGNSIKLSSPMNGAGLWQFEYSSDSSQVTYAAEQSGLLPELYRVEIASPGVSTKLNGALAPGGGVWSFIIEPGTMR